MTRTASSDRKAADQNKKKMNVSALILCAAALDAVVGVISGLGFFYYAAIPADIFPIYAVCVMICGVFYTIFSVYFRANSYEKLFDIKESLSPALLSWGFSMLALLCLSFFLKYGLVLTPYWVCMWFVVGCCTIVLMRIGLVQLANALHAMGWIEQRIVIVGAGEDGRLLIKALNSSAKGIRICGVFDDRSDERSKPIPGYPRLGSIDQLVEFARKTQVDLLVVAIPLFAETRLLNMLKKLWVLPVDIRISALSTQLRFQERSYSYLGTVPLLDIFDRPLMENDIVIKWLADKILGIIILILVSPIMLLAAIAVRLDSKGPILFKQKRYGFNNELIEVYKFRSMYVDMCDASASKLATRNDPRITRVGRIIRKTSIDELPQLFNVIFHGNISLVGPRPHALQAKAANQLYEEVVDGYFARHKVKPGITGYAQIHGWRGETDTLDKIQKRVEYDLYYIEKWSIFLDLYIIFMTPIALLMRNENAY